MHMNLVDRCPYLPVHFYKKVALISGALSLFGYNQAWSAFSILADVFYPTATSAVSGLARRALATNISRTFTVWWPVFIKAAAWASPHMLI